MSTAGRMEAKYRGNNQPNTYPLSTHPQSRHISAARSCTKAWSKREARRNELANRTKMLSVPIIEPITMAFTPRQRPCTERAVSAVAVSIRIGAYSRDELASNCTALCTVVPLGDTLRPNGRCCLSQSTQQSHALQGQWLS